MNYEICSVLKTHVVGDDKLLINLACMALPSPSDISSQCFSKVTKEISNILAPFKKGDEPHFIIIEGAPGIGKSVLLQ